MQDGNRTTKWLRQIVTANIRQHYSLPFVLPSASSSQEQGIRQLGSAGWWRRTEEFLCPLWWCQGRSLLLFSEPKRERDQASQFPQGKGELWNRSSGTSVPCLQWSSRNNTENVTHYGWHIGCFLINLSHHHHRKSWMVLKAENHPARSPRWGRCGPKNTAANEKGIYKDFNCHSPNILAKP